MKLLNSTENLENISSSAIKIAKPRKKATYGMELVLELFGCDLGVITSKAKIQEFIDGICQEIGMIKYGNSLIERFHGGGLWGEGYSFFQFITTSSITGHFIENGGVAFLNIFSCNEYNDQKAAEFAQKFFNAKKVKGTLIVH